MSRDLIPADSIKCIDVLYAETLYPVRTITAGDPPLWYDRTDDTETFQRHLDRVFQLVMCTSQLAEDIDNRMANSGQVGAQYADAIILSKTGRRAAIKDASILYFHDLDIRLLGGIFLFVDSEKMLSPKKEKMENIETDKPHLARFRQLLEE